MKIIKNEKRINRNGRIGRSAILAALIILGTGMYISVTNNTDPQMFTYSAVALIVGFVLMQIGIYMGNRYGRSPRPDEKLDTGLKGLNNDFVLYHYSTPVSHLLLGPAGVWVLLPYHQRGQATFKKNRWQMSGGGFAQAYMRIFGQEGLGRPDLEASSEISTLKKYLSKHMDETEIPEINALMVFTSDEVEIDGQDAAIPALKLKQMKEFIRKKVKDKTITPNTLDKIKSLFGEGNELTVDEKMDASFTAKTRVSSTEQKIFSPVLASLIGTLITLFPSNPNNMTLPSRDSGVFLYVGWRFLRGDVPYRDVWDHKPPLIYLIDALGLTLTPDSLWGVWLLQGILIFFTFFLLYKLLDEEFGTLAALGGTMAFATGLLTILARGNVTEEYALLFQVLCFLLFVRAYRQDFPIRTTFWIGIWGAFAFLFKQTTIGVWIVFDIILFAVRIYQRRSPLSDLLAHLTGWLIPIIIIVLFFASQNALTDLWEQAFLYNFTYIGKHEGIRRLIPVFVKGFLYLQNGWLLHLAIIGWLTGIAYIWHKLKSSFREIHPLILIAVIDLPIEVALITISGRSILHYYLTLLPVMAILTGTIIYGVPILMEKVKSPSIQRIKKWAPAILLAIIAVAQVGQIRYYPEYVRALRENDRVPVIDYILKNTEENDKVLIIGAESVVNFLARREAPTRYVYQYPLALLGRRPMFEEYFNQILGDKPVLIIDTRGRAQLTEKLYTPLQKRSQIVRDGVKYLEENYEQVAQFGEWFVYRLAENP